MQPLKPRIDFRSSGDRTPPSRRKYARMSRTCSSKSYVAGTGAVVGPSSA